MAAKRNFAVRVARKAKAVGLKAVRKAGRTNLGRRVTRGYELGKSGALPSLMGSRVSRAAATVGSGVRKVSGASKDAANRVAAVGAGVKAGFKALPRKTKIGLGVGAGLAAGGAAAGIAAMRRRRKKNG